MPALPFTLSAPFGPSGPIFDTGLSRSTRELIVGAIASKLAELKRPACYLTAIVSAPRMAGGKGDEDFVIELAKATNGRLPAIAIATGDAKTVNVSEDGLEVSDTIDVGIYVISGSQRGEVDGRLFVSVNAASDATKDPGVFAILQHVMERVQASELGIAGVSAPNKMGEDEIITAYDFTIWSQTYSVDVTYEIKPDRNETRVMTSIEALHEGDGIPDASSLDPLIETLTPLDPDEE